MTPQEMRFAFPRITSSLTHERVVSVSLVDQVLVLLVDELEIDLDLDL